MDVVGGDLDVVEGVIVEAGDGVPAVVCEGGAGHRPVTHHHPPLPLGPALTGLCLQLKCRNFQFPI